MLGFSYFFALVLVEIHTEGNKLKDLDVGIIIDDSVSVFEDDFMKEKEFIYRVYQYIDPASTNSRISAGKFSTDASVMVGFSDSQSTDLDSARKTIDCSIQTKGGTCLDKALAMANEQMFQPNVTRDVLIIMTDGSCNCAGCSSLSVIGTQIKQRGIDIITIGIGYGIDEQELKELASLPTNFISVKGFDDLLDILTSVFSNFQKINEEQSATRNKNNKESSDKMILNDNEYLKSSSGSQRGNYSKNYEDSNNGAFPYMNPIIVNIQTCPHSRVNHVSCKPGNSRCFQIERKFPLIPSDIESDLCRCSDLALRNNLNYFKIDDNGVCTIGTTSAEECGGDNRNTISTKMCKKQGDALYKTTYY